MDNLTHSLVGALIGQAGLKKKTGLAMPALIVGANIPDIDAACFFWADGVEHLGIRRGITHGPPAMVLLPLALAAILYGWDKCQARRGKRPEKRLPVSFKWLYVLSLIGCLSHPALDWMNSYGVRLLEPFSSRWFYGDVLFIIDIWLWLLLGFTTWFSLRREERSGEWMRPAQTALAVMLAYIGMNAAITWRMESAADAGEGTVIASPVPAAFWDRQMIAGGEGRYLVAGVKAGELGLTEAGEAAIAAAVPEAAPFLFWSRTPFVHVAADGGCFLRDARFTSREGAFTVELPEAFCETASAPTELPPM